MEFIETSTFTRMVAELLSDESYRELQNTLLKDPGQGAIIRGGGGIRKLRVALKGRGKSGGLRLIYYWDKASHRIYMLVLYPKTKQDTLSDNEISILRELAKEL